ncbi:ribonuclease H-like domain-containing protein [Tanacetum coccineum]
MSALDLPLKWQGSLGTIWIIQFFIVLILFFFIIVEKMSVHGYTDDEFEPNDQPTLISSLDVNNTLHLHPNDSAALIVISVKLKGTENYQVWSCVMLLALEGKNKTGFIDGTCKRSNIDEVLGRWWDRVNAIVLGWILNSISEELLNALWKHFDALVHLPRCTCHATDDFKKYNQLMKLLQFLMGLDDSYMQIRSNILSRDVVPNVRNAYAIISSEESHRVRSQASSSNSRPFNVTRPSSNGNKRPNGGLPWFVNTVEPIKHLTYTAKDLGNVIDISNLGITVSHFNGTEACITKVRNMILNENLTLYDVLVVSKYCVSLMCVLKVARDSKLTVAFDESKCYVLPHDLRDMKVLEIGNQKDGLYYFNEKQVHLDLWGTYKVISKEGFKHFLTTVDDYTRAVWVYLIKTKDKVFDCILTLYNLIKNQFGKIVKVFRSDNGTEWFMEQSCGWSNFAMASQLLLLHDPLKGLSKDELGPWNELCGERRKDDLFIWLTPSPSLYEPVMKQLAIKVWDEYGFVIRPCLVGVTFKFLRTEL